MSAARKGCKISPDLAQRVQRHLCDEETTLVGILDAVRQLHHSLRHLDGEALASALRSETVALQHAEGMRDRRQQIRNAGATELGIDPQEFTLGMLVANTSGDVKSSLAESRRKLEDMSAEMNHLNQQNAAMIQQSLMLVRGIVGRLTGTVASGESYNASGVREEVHVGSLVQWGG